MTPKTCTVSVVVPVYNAVATLSRCLDSLSAQTLSDIEMLVVDDASTDGSSDVINQHAKHDSRIHAFVGEKNINSYDARLVGFREATGRFIAACDSDDVMPPDALELLCAAAKGGKVDIVHGRSDILDDRKPGGEWHLARPFRAETGRGFVSAMLRYGRGWNIWGKLFSRECVRKAIAAMPEGRNWHTTEDLLYCWRFGLHADRYAALDHAVYLYSPPGENPVRRKIPMAKLVDDQLDILAVLVRDAMEEEGLDGEMTDFVARRLSALSWGIPGQAHSRVPSAVAGYNEIRRNARRGRGNPDGAAFFYGGDGNSHWKCRRIAVKFRGMARQRIHLGDPKETCIFLRYVLSEIRRRGVADLWRRFTRV